jgi:hypothetical protein
MTGNDTSGAPDAIASGFAALVDGLRDDIRDLRTDVREDLVLLEGRVTDQVAAVKADQLATHKFLEDYAKGHSIEHESEASDRRAAHGTFYDFIRKFELDQARRDGALGMVRYLVELLSKHGPRLATAALGIAAALGVATGSIHVTVAP